LTAGDVGGKGVGSGRWEEGVIPGAADDGMAVEDADGGKGLFLSEGVDSDSASGAGADDGYAAGFDRHGEVGNEMMFWDRLKTILWRKK